jgi:hypothetical protein
MTVASNQINAATASNKVTAMNATKQPARYMKPRRS